MEAHLYIRRPPFKPSDSNQGLGQQQESCGKAVKLSGSSGQEAVFEVT